MTKQTLLRRSLIATLGIVVVATAAPVIALDFGNMMNPSQWMGGGRNRDYGHGDDGPWGGPGYGYGGPGYGGPGYGYGGPGYGGPGYGGPGYGSYGGPEYGYGAPGSYGGLGAPGYGYGSGYPVGDGYGSRSGPPALGTAAASPTATTPVYGSPSGGESGGQAELERLRQRVRALEGSQGR